MGGIAETNHVIILVFSKLILVHGEKDPKVNKQFFEHFFQNMFLLYIYILPGSFNIAPENI